MTEVIDNETGEVTERLDGTPNTAAEALRQARELVTTGPAGIQIENLAQQIDYAKAMMKARVALPEHLHENVGDCLAIIDIAMRANLSPYMLALQTYVEPKAKRLSFMSQAYHALATPYLKGELTVTYDGEGEERTCTVSGVLKADPNFARSHTSPPLGKVRPPRNSDGIVKGSPLWDRKPDMQLFYDTSRDWVRTYCPRATLGLYTSDEMADYEAMRDVTPPTPGLAKRLRGGAVSRKEGHAVSAPSKALEAAKNGAADPQPPAKESAPAKPAAKPKAAPKAAPAEPEPEPEAAAPEPAPKPKAGRRLLKVPTTPKEWDTYCRAWLAEYDDSREINLRWRDERKLRNACGVTSEQRGPVEEIMYARLKELNP